MKQLLLILNPIAGTKKAAKHLTQIVSLFNRADFDVHVYVTSCKKEATFAVKTLGKEADLIVCCGGDGTFNETVTGLIESGMKKPIGYIPSGSTNDFANSLHLSTDVMKACTQILEGKPTPFDVGTFHDQYFTYVASFGSFTKASYNTPQNIKNVLGHVAYILEGIQELSSMRKEHVCIEIDGEKIEDDFLFGAICNSTTLGGILTLSPDVVDMSDGLFEVLLVKAPKDIQELGECIFALSSQKYDSKMITLKSGKDIKVHADSNMLWSLDGEKAEGAECIEIKNLHNRIEIIS